MSSRGLRVVVALVVCLGGEHATHAGGFAIGEQGAIAGGTGGAGTARADDAAAAWYNPAALAGEADSPGGWRIGAGVLAALPQLSAEAPDGSWQTDSEATATPLPQLYAAYAQGPRAFGIAINVPFGGGVRWPDDWEGRHEIVATRLAVARIAPFLAWRFGAWRVAGGVHLDAADLRIERGLDFIDADGDVQLALRGVGVGVDLAAFTRQGAVDLGVSYKSRTRIALAGEADFTTPDAFAMKAVDQHVDSEVTMPDRLAVGASWRHGPWRALADLELTLWQVNRVLVIDFAEEQTPDVTQTNDWHATLAVRGGAEWQRGPWVLRGGAHLDPTPAGAEHMAASSPDATRLGVTVGASRRFDSGLSLDAFYGYLHLLARDADNPDSLAARYGGHAQLLGVGVSWQP